MFERRKQRLALRQAAWKATYGLHGPDVRDELRKVGYSSIVPLVRTAEQAATAALVLVVTALVGLPEFVPMSGASSSSAHHQIA